MSKYCVTNIIIGQVNDIRCQTCGFGQVLPPHFQFTCFSLIDISCLLMCSAFEAALSKLSYSVFLTSSIALCLVKNTRPHHVIGV